MLGPRGLRTFQSHSRRWSSRTWIAYNLASSFSTNVYRPLQQPAHSSPKPIAKPKRRPKPQPLAMAFHPGPQTAEIVTPSGVVASTSITLSESECALFSVLLATLKSYPELSATTVRVAGGWVRDKVLGRESHDLDIALDTHTGTQFAGFVNDFLSKSGHSTSRIATIASNPDQSKHLETATVKVLGELVDFVNLRSETYAGHSRIPTMEFGTPQQDAERRDFTMNALFYNVNTAQIEDFTGQGYSDLRAGLLRTPLPPVTTFHDDPLRIMRAIRFGSRFGFTLHPDIVAAIANADVQKELMTKVSRERIGSELDNMLLGARPVGSIELLQSNALLSLLFQSPLPCVLDPLLASAAHADAASLVTSPDFPWAAVVPVASRIEPHLTYLGAAIPLAAATLSNRDLMRQVYYACILVGFSDAKFTERVNKNFDVTRHIVKDVVKRSAGDADAVVMLQTTALGFIRTAISSRCSEAFLDDADVKLACGRRIRQAKELWCPAVVLASSLCAELGKTTEASWLLELARRIASDAVLSTAWTLRALINGKEIAKDFGVVGPDISKLVEAQIDYLVLHPHATVEDCVSLLRAECGKK